MLKLNSRSFICLVGLSYYCTSFEFFPLFSADKMPEKFDQLSSLTSKPKNDREQGGEKKSIKLNFYSFLRWSFWNISRFAQPYLRREETFPLTNAPKLSEESSFFGRRMRKQSDFPPKKTFCGKFFSNRSRNLSLGVSVKIAREVCFRYITTKLPTKLHNFLLQIIDMHKKL